MHTIPEIGFVRLREVLTVMADDGPADEFGDLRDNCVAKGLGSVLGFSLPLQRF